MGQTSRHSFEEAGIGLTSLTFDQDGAHPPLQVILIFEIPSNYTLGPDSLFVTTT